MRRFEYTYKAIADTIRVDAHEIDIKDGALIFLINNKIIAMIAVGQWISVREVSDSE